MTYQRKSARIKNFFITLAIILSILAGAGYVNHLDLETEIFIHEQNAK